jgi:16S rRNA (uracil1498-N3)-methyltransferase
MTAPRFLSLARLAPELAGQTVELHESVAHHATRVLRLAVGDALTLFDGTGGEYAATLVRADRRGAAVRIESFLEADRESPLALTLAQGIAAGDAMEYAIRKATELGATAIQPLVTARSAPLPSGERGERRLAHWRQIAIAACEQCGRNRVPDVLPPRALTEWLATWKGSGVLPVRLGPRVLRTETAAAAVLAVVQAMWGDWR